MHLTELFSISIILACLANSSCALQAGLFGSKNENEFNLQEMINIIHQRGDSLSIASEETIRNAMKTANSRGLSSPEKREVEERAKTFMLEDFTFHHPPARSRLGQEMCEGLCIDGLAPENGSLEIVDVTGDGVPETCDQLDSLIKALSKDHEVCLEGRFELQPLCCGESPRCQGIICPGGMGPLNPDAVLNFDLDSDGNPDTCLEVHNALMQYPESSDVCQNIPEDITSTCCEDLSYECESVCRVGGSLPPENASKPLMLPGYNTTCGEFASMFPMQTASEEICDEIQFYVSQECGCVSPHCSSMCADGSSVSEEFLDVVTNEDGSTCRDLEFYATMFPVREETCTYIQAIGNKRCGCPTLPPIVTDCSICADGSSVSDENKFNEVTLGFANRTCASIEIDALFNHPDECPLFQKQGFEFCGCPTSPEPAEKPCEICGNGFSTNDDLFVEEFGTTCGTIKEYAQLLPYTTDTCVEAKLGTYEENCCIGEARCPDLNYTEFSIYSKPNPIRPCSWINTLNPWRTEKFCSAEESDGMANCPYTCAGHCSCQDRKWKRYNLKNGREKTCYWLAKKNKRQIRRVCNKNPTAREACPHTCEGWCYFK